MISWIQQQIWNEKLQYSYKKLKRPQKSFRDYVAVLIA
jgi:hypothetical protein